MKNIVLVLSFALVTSCGKTLSIDGFDKECWFNYEENCSTYRLNIADFITENQDILLKGTQNDVESLLGKATEHELYERNQKFFHYRLTPPNACGEYETIQYLSVRFNAIGKANLVQVMLREPR